MSDLTKAIVPVRNRKINDHGIVLWERLTPEDVLILCLCFFFFFKEKPRCIGKSAMQPSLLMIVAQIVLYYTLSFNLKHFHYLATSPELLTLL